MSKWIAEHLPRRIVYWAAMRLISHACSGRYGTTEVPGLTAMDAVARW